jgi:hypothetical protein
MTPEDLTELSEDELDRLVSIAIQRAEILDDLHSPATEEAWREVMLFEEQLARITPAADIAGRVARVGAIRAALSAGDRAGAARLASLYLAEESLPRERRVAVERAFEEDREKSRPSFSGSRQ